MSIELLTVINWPREVVCIAPVWTSAGIGCHFKSLSLVLAK